MKSDLVLCSAVQDIAHSLPAEPSYFIIRKKQPKIPKTQHQVIVGFIIKEESRSVKFIYIEQNYFRHQNKNL